MKTEQYQIVYFVEEEDFFLTHHQPTKGDILELSFDEAARVVDKLASLATYPTVLVELHELRDGSETCVYFVEVANEKE